MKLEVLRISSQNDSTSGILFDVTDGKRKFLCYTLEDEYRRVKVKHETRIPEGTYKLTLRSCLLYTSPSPRDRTRSRMPSSA